MTSLPTTRTELISYLQSLPSNHIISGQHNREPSATYPAGSWNWDNAPDPKYYRPWTDKVNAITGLYPGLWGGDFLYSSPFTGDDWRGAMVQQAISQWQAGSLVNLTWHMTPPNASDRSTTWDSSGDQSVKINDTGFWREDSSWQDLLDYGANGGQGSDLYRSFLNRLEEAVPHFQTLTDAGVVVLFRPFHEINTGWSWWGAGGDANASQRYYRQQLYRYTYNFFANTHGFDNIVWVWNVQDDGDPAVLDQLYPGADVVDVISHDVWDANQPEDDWYQALTTLAGGKPLALGEVGRLPDPNGALISQPGWKYFMCWAEYIDDDVAEASQIHNGDIGDQSNANQYTKDVYYNGSTLHQGQIGGSSPTPTDNYETVGLFLVQNGYTAVGAAGVCGCIAGESGGDPEALEHPLPEPGGAGLIQWTPAESMEQYGGTCAAAGIGTYSVAVDLQKQMTAILRYNAAQGSSMVTELNNQSGPVAAADFYSINFERPVVQLSDVRPDVAKSVYEFLTGNTPPPPRVLPGRPYTIQPGDTLYNIATFAYGAANADAGVSAIENANPGIDPYDLQPGEVINIPAL